MVWSKQEFEREVRRQIVELESIRKRISTNTVSAKAEALEKIDRLEASHRNLLRKLKELFTKAPSKKKPSKQAEVGGGELPAIFIALEKYLKCLEPASPTPAGPARAGGLDRSSSGEYPGEMDESSHNTTGCSGGAGETAHGPPSGFHHLFSPDARELPSLSEKCGFCGNLLISSLLGGDEVFYFEEAWYHRSCAEEGDAFVKPGLLN